MNNEVNKMVEKVQKLISVDEGQWLVWKGLLVQKGIEISDRIDEMISEDIERLNKKR